MCVVVADLRGRDTDTNSTRTTSFTMPWVMPRVKTFAMSEEQQAAQKSERQGVRAIGPRFGACTIEKSAADTKAAVYLFLNI